jgi:hypothetical protein
MTGARLQGVGLAPGVGAMRVATCSAVGIAEGMGGCCQRRCGARCEGSQHQHRDKDRSRIRFHGSHLNMRSVRFILDADGRG